MRRALAAVVVIAVALVVALFFVMSDPVPTVVEEPPPSDEATLTVEDEGVPRERQLRALVPREGRPRLETPERAPADDVEPEADPSPPEVDPKRVDVRVRVSFTDGAYVPDAAVRASELHGMVQGRGLSDAGSTDANGVATLAVAPSHRFIVYATSGEYVGMSDAASTFNLSAGDVVEVVLERAVHVTGRLSSSAGGAVADAEVTLNVYAERFISPSWITTSDESGAFRFPAIPRGLFVALEGADEAVHTLDVRAAGFTPAQRQVSAVEVERGPVEIELAPGVRVTGRVLQPNGSPVAGAKVFAPDWTGVETDADGRYEFDGLGRDGGILRVLPPPPHAPIAGPDVPMVPGEYTLPDVFLREGRSIRVRVVDVSGQPLEGVSVSAGDTELELSVRSATTDADGRADLPALAERAHQLHLDQPSEESWAAGREMTVPEVHPLVDVQQFILQGQRTVHLVFLDAADRTPITVSSADVDASPVDAGGGTGWGWEGGSIQSVRIQVETAGLYDVTVELPGYEKETAAGLMVPENGELRIEVLLRKRP